MARLTDSILAEQQRALAELRATGSTRANQRYVEFDAVNSLVWGTDEYGCDTIAVGDTRTGDWPEKAVQWLFHEREQPHPAEFSW